MRRKMEAILLALLTAALLAGCGDGEDAPGPLKEVRALPLESTESGVQESGAQEAGEDPSGEDPARRQLETLYANLSLEEYWGEGISMLCSPDWYEALLGGKEKVTYGVEAGKKGSGRRSGGFRKKGRKKGR